MKFWSHSDSGEQIRRAASSVISWSMTLTRYVVMFRYFMEYEYQSDVRDLCSVCSLAYSQACKVRKCPLILVEVMN